MTELRVAAEAAPVIAEFLSERVRAEFQFQLFVPLALQQQQVWLEFFLR